MARSHTIPRRRNRLRERGAALITALLCMSLLYALALALLLSTTTDVLITTNYRASEEAFFAADAGVALGRIAVRRAVTEQIAAIAANPTRAYRSDSQVLPDSESAPNAEFFRLVTERAAVLANEDVRSKLPNDARYQVEVLSIEGGPTAQPIRNPRNGLESYVYTYTIRSTGRSAFGARAEVVERGKLHTELTASVPVSRSPYSKYGTFFDRGDPQGGLVLVSGTFTGPVHTNSHFAFSSSNTVVFRGRVTQGDSDILYDGRSAPIPETSTKGIVVGDGAYRQGERVPLPKNNFSQELAVVNGSGYAGSAEPGTVDGSGRVTPDTLASNLADAQGRPATTAPNGVAPGVYVASSDGASITGGGIYVSGDAEVSLSVSGDDQVVSITQGGQTSTITIDYDGNRTVFSSGGVSRTFGGVPMDTSLGASQATPGVSLFVNGSVTSLSGPSAVDGTTGPALAPDAAMTITAQRHVTITGDLKYSDPVVASDGTPLPRANQNKAALGIFTNDGNVVLQPDADRTSGRAHDLEIHAAIAAFNANTGNDGGKTEGAILFGEGTPAANSTLRIVGARIQANIANIKYRKRAIYFDPRLDGGQFAPPFFPGTEIKPSTGDLEIAFPGEAAVRIYADAWQRDERRRKRED